MSHLGKVKLTIFTIIGAVHLTTSATLEISAIDEADLEHTSARVTLVYESIHNPPRAHGERAAIAEIKASDGLKAIFVKN